MITFTLDDTPITVPKGTTVFQAAKQRGIEIPIFCYQDRMPPFGACRVCLVEVEKMAKLQTSCTLEATEGMVVRTQSKIAQDGRKGILEFLLINHPLDCPICDRGGECPLQDQAIKYGPGESRFFEEKRHFVKAKSLGPVLMLDRERCIVCARCTRFSDTVSGDHALEFIDRGFKTEVGTPDGMPVQSKFIGNTIMICPVGALTSEVYRFRARPWDNDHTASTCTLCPVGCSLTLDSRDGEIMRTRSCENRDVNDLWLCDKGWFGYEFTSSEERLQKPLIRRNGQLEPASWDEALTLIASKMRESKPSGKLAAFGGNPLTTEENFLFQRLMREGLEVNNLDHRIGMPVLTLENEGTAPGMEISIGECENLSYVILAGLDLTEEFPVIWLRLKQAINRGARVIFIGNYAPEIAPHLEKTILHAPGHELVELKKHLPEIATLAQGDKRGAIFVGRQYLNTTNRLAILAELDACRQKTPNLSLNLLEGRGNSAGARFAGMRPDLQPGGNKHVKPGLNAVEVLDEAARNGWGFLYVVGADPAKKYPSNQWKAARAKLDFLVVQDLFLTETAKEADVVLPTLSFVEKQGSFINIENRIQKIQPGKKIPSGIYSDSEIFTLLALKLNFILKIDNSFEEILQTETHVKIPSYTNKASFKHEEKSSGKGLKATFAPALFDQGNRMKHNPHVIQLAKDPMVRLHPTVANQLGLKQGERAKISANGSSITAKVKHDEKVSEGTVVIPLGFDEVAVYELGANLLNGMEVEIARA